MKGLVAFLLITAGTLAASLAVARTDTSVAGWMATWQVSTLWAVVGLVLITAGILVQRSGKAASGEEARVGLAGLDAVLGKVVGEVDRLGEAIGTLELSALHARVDEILTGPVTDFTEGRQALIDVFGVGSYAEVMGPFAQGERYLNRAWSASADGDQDEAETYARKAGPLFREAHRKRGELGTQGAEA
ncbi:hypothetical protein K8I85_16865 [bacterium]|nr:hypothetical protein [bacterium]